MNQTGTSTAQIVQAYYDILTGGIAAYDPARLRALLATDLVFEGPIAGHVLEFQWESKTAWRMVD